MNKFRLCLLIFAPTLVCAQTHENTEGDAESAIENVVVYGQKIERTLQDTKESIAVISEEFIDNLTLLDLEDTFFASANVFTLSNGENFGIRGVTQNSASTGGGDGELGSLYMDGVALTGFATRFGPKDLWDVEQIEILRGPQSTNVGRRALIGAVVINTKDPDPSNFDAAIRGQFASYDTFSGEGMINTPVSESSAFRFTVEHYYSDGYIDNVVLDEDDYDASENTTLRGKYLFESSDNLRIEYMVQYAETDQGWDTYRADLTGIESFETSANLEGFETYEALSSALDITYQLNEQWSVRSITSALRGEYERFNDDDGGPEGGNAFRGRDVEDRNWAEELRFNFVSENLNGVIGIYYTDVEIANNTSGFVAINPALLGVPDTLLPFYPEILEVIVGIPANVDTTNFALFAEWDWDINEKYTISAGLRYDREEQDVLTNAINSLAEGSFLPDPNSSGQAAANLGFDEQTVALIVAGITQVNGVLEAQLLSSDNPTQSKTFDAFLPQLGLTYSVSEDLSIATFYKRGYRAGGVDVDTTGDVDEFDPEYLDNFELALRSVHLDGQLIFNANAFYGLWTDQQLTIYRDGSSFDTEIINAGESKLYGLEMELQYSPSDRTHLFTSVGIAKTEFVDFCLTDGTPASDITGPVCDGGEGQLGKDLSGFDFASSPDYTLAAGGRHQLTEHFFVAGAVTHQSAAFSDVENTQLFENDGFTLVNLSAGYELDDFAVTIYGRNLLDEFYTNFQGEGVGSTDELIVTVGTPREYGLTIYKNF